MHQFRSLDLAVDFYEKSQKLKLKGNLANQLERAASSIALNLAEGNAKASANDKRNFFQTAYGSLRECQTILRLLKIDDSAVIESADKLGGCLYKLVNSDIKPAPNWRRSEF